MNPNHEEPHPLPDENPRTDKVCREIPFRSCESREALRELGEAVRKAFQAGAEDARDSARKALPMAKEQFARGLHDIAYGVAYAASFGGAVVREMTPGLFVEGFEEGQEAGRRAAEAMIQKTRKRTGAARNPGPDPGVCAGEAAGDGKGEAVVV